jgi:geranylgeranylglycerol-phosphate geranylgeranyltransferase
VAALASSGGNGLNDYYDERIDAVAHPERPIPSGYMSPKNALFFSLFCFVFAIFLAFFTGWECLLIAAVNITLMAAYEKKLKKTGLPGNLVISYLVASLFLFGGAAAGSFSKTLILFPLAFLAILGREIAKDVEDLAGDQINRLTLPMKIGRMKASILASSLIFLAVALSPLPYLYDLYGASFMYLLLPADLLFILSAIILLQKITLGEELAKYGMLLGIGAFLGGSFL